MKDAIIIGKRYEVLSKIGAGGMADVYKGHDTKLDRNVAIKVLKKEYREDANFVDKFISEAQSAAGLMHPNIVNVYDVGEDRGLYYMVMELVEGITLKDYIRKKGKLSHPETVSIAIQVCNGLGAAHAAGIVHRDIKPHNIIISKDGKVKVTDFGIAKAITSETVTTNAMGSVHYTSPEQARGGYSDAKSDIYSMGITLFEMVTGRVPFDGDSTVSVAMKHIQEDITLPTVYAPDLPYSLEQIILKCTQKNVERRYKNVDELIKDLKHSLIDPEGHFVAIAPEGTAETILINMDDMNNIRRRYGGRKPKREEVYVQEDEELEEDEDLEEIEDEEDDYEEAFDDDYPRKSNRRRKGGAAVNPGMSKLVKILTAVVGAIILLILIFMLLKAAGLFKGGTGDLNEDQNTEELEGMIDVPNLLGLTKEEAERKLAAYDLVLSVKAGRESEQYEEGQISEQTPAEGKKVEAGSTVEVVLSTGLIGAEIEIPDISGMSEDQAKKALKELGFEAVTSDYLFDPDIDEGDAIGTQPSAHSKATKKTPIIVQISKGVEKFEVPNVSGQDRSAAESALKNAGFQVSVKEEFSDSVESGKVISQSPSGGKKADDGSSVEIVVSKGKEKVTIPNVGWMTESEATSTLQGLGLNVSVVRQNDSTVSSGLCIETNPYQGQSVDKGTTVTLYVSTGPAATPTPDPGTQQQQQTTGGTTG
ncbi:MAG: Stk1 family PASTA domain-containing Ser/Thr kinase [Lachnospiraceae bacterium]|jgi:serine/threonine-protein kinase|nr:Stk1 family PASTA domain-containing Ser/Thr kinase [Lachnospiraceae bacterium]